MSGIILQKLHKRKIDKVWGVGGGGDLVECNAMGFIEKNGRLPVVAKPQLRAMLNFPIMPQGNVTPCKYKMMGSP